MVNIKEISLSKALSEKRLKELPKQYRDNCGEYWLEAIVLVRKRDLSQSYATAKRGADGKITFMQDFGELSPISGIVSIHPYMYINKEVYMPYENIEQMRHALIQYIGGDEEAKEAVNKLHDSEVQFQILQIAIESQYAGMNINDTHQSILDAVGVTPEPTISFESEKQNEGTYGTDASSEKADGADKAEPGSNEISDTDRPSDEDKVWYVDGDSDNADVTIQVDKLKGKGGRPKGRKNNTTRKTTKK